MLKRPTFQQTELEMVTLESLVPADHPPRKVDTAIDFGFIRDLTEELYCLDNGKSPLTRTHGWAVHSNENGFVA